MNKNNEILVGIDPESTIGMGVLRFNRLITEILRDVKELKKEIAALEEQISERHTCIEPSELAKCITDRLSKTEFYLDEIEIKVNGEQFAKRLVPRFKKSSEIETTVLYKD